MTDPFFLKVIADEYFSESVDDSRELLLKASNEIQVSRATLFQIACLIPGHILRQALQEQKDSVPTGQKK